MTLSPASSVSSKTELLGAEFVVRVSVLQVSPAVQKESLGEKGPQAPCCDDALGQAHTFPCHGHKVTGVGSP